MKYVLPLFIFILAQPSAFAERVRHVTMKRDQIVQVKAALGVATIVQVADSPTSLVVGDNEAFKVEFLESAITIKPLHAGAKSNLYIYTEYRRFDVQLITVPEPGADYVVYLDNFSAQSKPKPMVRWRALNLAFTNDELRVRITRIGLSDTSTFVEFEIAGIKDATFDPSAIWLTQSKNTVPIYRLVLSNLTLARANPIHGVAEIAKSDLKVSSSLAFELRRKTSSRVLIPGVVR